MAEIRKIFPGRGATSVVAFHGFNVLTNGELQYTKSTDDTDIQDGDQLDNYVMHEISTRGATFKINSDGELIIEYESDE